MYLAAQKSCFMVFLWFFLEPFYMVFLHGFFMAFSSGPTLFTWSRQVSDANAFLWFFSRPGPPWNHEFPYLDDSSLPYQIIATFPCTDGPKWPRSPRTHLRPPGCQRFFMVFLRAATFNMPKRGWFFYVTPFYGFYAFAFPEKPAKKTIKKPSKRFFEQPSTCLCICIWESMSMCICMYVHKCLRRTGLCIGLDYVWMLTGFCIGWERIMHGLCTECFGRNSYWIVIRSCTEYAWTLRVYSWLFLCMAVPAFCQWGYSWLSMAIRGYHSPVAIFLAVRGYLCRISWLFVAIRVYSWLFFER